MIKLFFHFTSSVSARCCSLGGRGHLILNRYSCLSLSSMAGLESNVLSPISVRSGKELQRHISSYTDLADDTGQSLPPSWGSSRGQSWFQLFRREPESTRFTVLSLSNNHKGGLTFIDAHTVYPLWHENRAERDFRGIKVNVWQKSEPGRGGTHP